MALALLCALAACGRDPEAELATALESRPGVAARLSVASDFRRCSERVPEGGTIPRAHCPALRAARGDALPRVAARWAGTREGPAALHGAALVGLTVDDATGKALDRSISDLREAAALAERPAPVLADLAAALVVRAERAQAPRDLLEAYETAEEALRLEPRGAAALFNRALALDRFGLVDETARAWRDYLAADSTSSWAEEARRRLRTALSTSIAPPPADGAPLAACERYAAAEPQGAREMGMDRLLGAWGEAVEAGGAARAEDRLRRAEALGRALERRPGGDASLADAVRAIRAAAASPAATRALARAHRDYAAGQDHLRNEDFASAEPRLAAAAEAGSPALKAWARVHLGIARAYSRDRDSAVRILAAAAEADPERYPAAAARARWPLARILGQGDQWERALDESIRSARLFARAGERENEGAVLGIAADARFVLGEPDSGYVALHRGLDRLKPYRGSTRLHALLAAATGAAAQDGLLRSAVRIQGEDVAVAARTGDAMAAAEARVEQARQLAASGDPARAAAELRAARGLTEKISDPGARDWIESDLRDAEAVVSYRADPARTTQVLDSVAAYFATVPNLFRVLPALVGAAEARLRAGDATGAARRLEAAVRLLDQRRDSIRMEPRRAAVFDAARGVVDRIVMLKLAEGRAAEALDHMDRGRASLAPAGGPTSGRETGVRAPPGEVALEYARVADTLLVWAVAGERVEVARTVVDTLRLARTLAELERAMAGRAPEAEVRPALSLLYEWLVRPVEGRLGAPGTPLVVVADGEIASVPFAALYDARGRRYLVERHPLRAAASLREARRGPAARPAEGVLLVADPAFDRRQHPLLDRLRHAREEVRSIAPAYPGAVVLEGQAATRAAVERALPRAGVAHVAGHAVFDDQRPERSYLVLAPSGDGAGEKITAAELARLDLRGVRLVVLSACRTVRSGRGRAGGFTGLSGALLAAGAGGAVGSTWEVDDRSTAALMTELHRAYRAGGDGPRALRAAQLALLRSDDPALRSPAAWAGFRYAGR